MKRSTVVLMVLGLSAVALSTTHSLTLALNDSPSERLHQRFEDSHKENLNALSDRFEEARQGTLNS